MIFLWLLSLLLPAQSVSAGLAGEWRNVDYRAVEVLPSGCVRVWLEERTYAFQTLPDNRVQGAYQNIVRAIPTGAMSYSPTCKYPAPTDNPIANQMRMWSVVASPQSDGAWKLRAQPGPGGGDFSTFKAEDFSTELRLSNGALLDGAGPPDDADKVLAFRRPTASPSGARSVLESTITRLNNGGCLEVMSAMAVNKAGVADVCELRRQMLTMQGRYVSLTINADAQIDRITVIFGRR